MNAPDLGVEWDEDGPQVDTLSAGWTVSFGCRVTFGPDPDGQLRVTVSVSDAARRDGVATTPTTPTALRVLAAHLLAVADQSDTTAPPVQLARCENYREDLDMPCDGVLAFRDPPDREASCGTCGGRCGRLVANYFPPTPTHEQEN